jgi:hypothetical protein
MKTGTNIVTVPPIKLQMTFVKAAVPAGDAYDSIVRVPHISLWLSLMPMVVRSVIPAL